MKRLIWNRHPTPIPPPVVCLVNKVTKVGEDPQIDYRLIEIYRASLALEFWFFRFEIKATSPWLPSGGLIGLSIAAEPSIWSDLIQADQWETISIPVRDPRGTICLQGVSGTMILFDLWLRLDQLTAGKEIP
jgi:hypothetical protein